VQKLFLRGETVTTDQAGRVFLAHGLDTLIRSGLVLEDQGWVRSLFKVQSYQGLIFLSDFLDNRQAPDFVLQVGPAGQYLANLTIREKVSSALDLGCGCGVQSLLAARHCARVMATDINPRALALTRVNAEINGVSNVEVLEGSYFEPVEGRLFDLVLSNLPYVIAPEIRFIYRNTDQPGDASILRLIRDIPSHLTEGGHAHVLVNWVHAPTAPWWQPLRTTIEGTGADAWLIYNGSKDVQSYAGMWIDGETNTDARASARARRDWMRWYRRHGIERIALGAVHLRRRAPGPNWFCTALVEGKLEIPAGWQLKRLFAAQDLLSAFQRPDDLLTRTLVPWQIETTVNPGGQQVRVRSTAGLRLQTDVHSLCLRVLGHLKGDISLQTALDQAAQEQGILPEELSAAVLEDIRRLVHLGMVIPG